MCNHVHGSIIFHAVIAAEYFIATDYDEVVEVPLCFCRAIVGYVMEHEDVIKIPVNLKELQYKVKRAQAQLSQVIATPHVT